MIIFLKVCVFIAILTIQTQETYSSKILVLAPFYGKSHSIFINSIVSELANRNHDIVLITSNPMKDTSLNIRQIITKDNSAEIIDPSSLFELLSMPVLFLIPFMWNRCLEMSEDYISQPVVQDFIKEKNTTFDLVISELFFQDAFYMFAHKYQAPLILLGSSSFFTGIEDIMGHDSSLSYIRHELSTEYGEMSFLQRIQNHFMGNFAKLGDKFYMKKQHTKIALRHIMDLPQPVPSIAELEKNVSLVLMNTHYSYDTVRPLVPGVVEIGGVHIKPPNSLPNDIQTFLDGAKDGVIYFSLGTNLKSSMMSEEVKNIFFKVLKNLKQRVLWKFEDELPEKLPNVMISKWLPQSDILAHPNIRLFISHGGMLGTQEAIYRGVPVLGISVYGDQHQNMAKLMTKNMGIHLRYSEITEEKLENALNALLTDSSYAENAKLISNRYHDQQNTPMEKAMFWIEYVIRHKGAPFMKSKMVNLPWHHYHFLDVYAFYLFIDIIIYFTLKKCFRKISFATLKYPIALLAVGCGICLIYFN